MTFPQQKSYIEGKRESRKISKTLIDNSTRWNQGLSVKLPLVVKSSDFAQRHIRAIYTRKNKTRLK